MASEYRDWKFFYKHRAVCPIREKFTPLHDFFSLSPKKYIIYIWVYNDVTNIGPYNKCALQ